MILGIHMQRTTEMVARGKRHYHSPSLSGRIKPMLLSAGESKTSELGAPELTFFDIIR